MDQEKISEALNELDDKYIKTAATYQEKKKSTWNRWYGVAACICFVAVAVFTVPNLLKQPATVSEDRQPADTAISGDGEQEGVSIPAIKLPKSSDISTADMVLLVVYQGRIYTQVSYYAGRDAEPIKELVGDCLGYAKGNIDEWSSQDDYATEFASNYQGKVYSVKGYDTNFRLCISHETKDDIGNTYTVIQFLENLNGIMLRKGSDLFVNRLKLSENWVSVRYQTHDNWDDSENNPEYHELDNISVENINDFLNELNSSDFEDISDSKLDFYSDSKEQAHLFFSMKDGTEVELRLFEGGYVGYQELGGYFVKMPGDLFNTIFNACTQKY